LLYVHIQMSGYTTGSQHTCKATSILPTDPDILCVEDTYLILTLNVRRGHSVALLLRHYATSREVAGSRPDEVNEFFKFT
jgi:hypothetical protein